jgi:site-specific DNA-methyltransferase (adenine-specific)
MMSKEQIVYIEVSKLKLNEKNPRKNDNAVDGVAKSIEKYGFKNPLIVDRNNVVWCGNTRLKASKKLGLKEVPCIIADDLTEEQIREYALLDNKLNEIAEWDFELLGDELLELDLGDFELDWGLPELLEEKEVEEDDFDCTPPEQPKAKLGDIYQLGNHRLMCGDSTKEEDVAKLMNGNKADMVFTDPPYGMSAVSKSGVLSKTYKTDIMNDDTNEVAIDCFLLCQQMFNDAKQVWWGANYYTECLPSSECWIVWDKNNGASDQTDCELAWTNFRSVVRQFTLASEKKNRVHPTQKPIKLIAMIFEKFEKENKFNNVVDLFGGSGSTLIACEQLNRNCYMMELDPKYVDIIIARWEQFTGKKAEKLN